MEILIETISIYGSIVAALVTGVFFIALAKRDNSVMDIFYGPIYAIASWTTLWLIGSTSFVSLLIASLVTVWSLRLGIRIFRKNFGKPEDIRYANWRKAWLKHGSLYFLVRSYLQINILQGIIIVIVSLPIILVLANEIYSLPFVIASVAIFAFGLSYESIADWQLDRFIARKKAGTESATLMTKGLFTYSRRPNYFGESTLWWGLAIMALPSPLGWVALLGPLMITFIVTCVTGPILEKVFRERYPDAFSEYVATTSYFIPLPPKRH